MKKVYLLDCTLRDGGYVNNWNFGEETIKGFGEKIAKTGVEFYEVGFIKGDTYDPNKNVFPDLESIAPMITPKFPNMKYVGMIDMGAPIPIERIKPYDGSSIDGIRVIFKKSKIEEAYEYCKRVQELGYFISVNLVGTDLYSDTEFIEAIEKFNDLNPYVFSIVDSFGVIKRKQFLRLVYLADNNLKEGIILAYHAHNNLQQAYGNAEALVELNINRDVLIDACVFGMGRGAGNLNLELFAEYMNENYGTDYKIEPMLEIMDEYLNDIYRTKFWGYSLPLYMSANEGCHPNYSIYYAERHALTVKTFNELLQSIPRKDAINFSKEKAEYYLRNYLENKNIRDDKEELNKLREELSGKEIVILAPGKSLSINKDVIRNLCTEKKVIATNFLAKDFSPDYIFSSNMRRFVKIQGKTNAKCIVTSNIDEASQKDYIINFATYASKYADIIDNSVLMLLKLLKKLSVKKVYIAGMDGYSEGEYTAYYDNELEYDFTEEAVKRNQLISEELKDLKTYLEMEFVTPTVYNVE